MCVNGEKDVNELKNWVERCFTVKAPLSPAPDKDLRLKAMRSNKREGIAWNNPLGKI